jgi:hypothetical protein
VSRIESRFGAEFYLPNGSTNARFQHRVIFIMLSAGQFGSAVNDEVGMRACSITLLGTCFSCGDYFCYVNAQHRR